MIAHATAPVNADSPLQTPSLLVEKLAPSPGTIVLFFQASSTSCKHKDMMLLRHLLAILILPFTVVALIPYLLISTQEPGWTNTPLEWPARILGLLTFAAGFALFLWCIMLFARIGRGTLAPWDPTQSMVAAGPYRYVRNPMITGVITMLIGESLFFGSWAIALWALFVFTLNHFYFILSEEPGLEERFGPAYLTYKSQVPRWLPRLTRHRPR